jgi:hypothetical protein
MTSRRQCYFLPRHKAGRPRRGSRTLSSTLSSRHTTPPLPDPPTENEATELSHDHEWHATSTLPSFMNNALPTSDVSLPADLQTFTSAPLSHPTIITDYFSTNDNVGFQPQPQSNGNSEGGLSCGPLTGSLSDSSGAILFPRIYPPCPGVISALWRHQKRRLGPVGSSVGLVCNTAGKMRRARSSSRHAEGA